MPGGGGKIGEVTLPQVCTLEESILAEFDQVTKETSTQLERIHVALSYVERIVDVNLWSDDDRDNTTLLKQYLADFASNVYVKHRSAKEALIFFKVSVLVYDQVQTTEHRDNMTFICPYFEKILEDLQKEATPTSQMSHQPSPWDYNTEEVAFLNSIKNMTVEDKGSVIANRLYERCYYALSQYDLNTISLESYQSIIFKTLIKDVTFDHWKAINPVMFSDKEGLTRYVGLNLLPALDHNQHEHDLRLHIATTYNFINQHLSQSISSANILIYIMESKTRYFGMYQTLNNIAHK